MRTYEALYIVQPDISDDEVQTVAQGVEGLITESGGSIVRSEIWGKRRLAYEVKKHNEGNYVLVRFQSAPDFIDRLEYHFRLSDPIIRYQVIYLDEHSLRLEEEQQRRNLALQQARGGEGPHARESREPRDREAREGRTSRPAPRESAESASEAPARSKQVEAETST